MKKLYVVLCLIFSLILTACNKKPSEEVISADARDSNSHISENERLGTTWGDEVTSHIKTVDAKRLSEEPIEESQLRYAAKAFTGKSINSMSLNAGKISFSVIGDDGKILPVFRDGKAYYLTAKDGQSYQLKYENHSNQAYEVVTSVDGLDVIDGSNASKYNRGYLLYPKATLIIEGFRKSDNAVASFTFGKPQDSYAANTSEGSEDNTGIIGMVMYETQLPSDEALAVEASTDVGFAPTPDAFPADKK